MITCAVTGYGHGNRHEDRPGYDALVAARSGLQWENRSWMGGAIDHRDAIATRLRARAAHDWFATLDQAGVPCEISSAHFADEFFDDPAMRARGRTIVYVHPEVGRFEHASLAIDFSDTPGIVWGPPPLVGQHSREVLAEFGFTTAEADALLAHGAVFATRSVND